MRTALSVAAVSLFLAAALREQPCAAGVFLYEAEADFLAAAGAPHTTIDFETYGDGQAVPEGSSSATGTEWEPFDVRFESLDPDVGLWLSGPGDYWTIPSGTHALRTRTDDSSMRITLLTPQDAVALTLVDSDRTGPNESITLLDAAGQTLGSFPMPYFGSATSGPEGNYFRGFVSDTRIAQIILSENPTDNEDVMVDDLMLVPEPATLTLLALGGLAMTMRRRR